VKGISLKTQQFLPARDEEHTPVGASQQFNKSVLYWRTDTPVISLCVYLPFVQANGVGSEMQKNNTPGNVGT
jgi:hypothetical protein